MNNYDLHERAQLLADTHSAYELAMMVVRLSENLDAERGQPGASTTACDDQFAADPNGDDQ